MIHQLKTNESTSYRSQMELSGHPTEDIIDELQKRGAIVTTRPELSGPPGSGESGSGGDQPASDQRIVAPFWVYIGPEVFDSASGR